MRESIKKLEYRLVIPGKPESFRSKKSKDFKTKISSIAKTVISKPIESGVEIYADYFYKRNRKMDMDNISKNILDALTGIAYKDDREVKSQKSRAHNLKKNLRITDLPLDSIKPLKKFDEYIFLRIREI